MLLVAICVGVASPTGVGAAPKDTPKPVAAQAPRPKAGHPPPPRRPAPPQAPREEAPPTTSAKPTSPAPAPPPPTILPPPDTSVPPPMLPRAPRERMRACAQEWEKRKLEAKAGLPLWRDFATQCLTR